MGAADLSLESFLPAVGQPFTVPVDDDHDDLVLELISAAPLPRGAEHGFTLEFTGPVYAVLEQGTYALTHPDLGTNLIFLVPVAQDQDARHYEAVFTRMPEAPTA